MDKYMLMQNLRARGVSPDEINDAVRFGDVTVSTKRNGRIDVIKRGSWYYLLGI